MAVARSRAWFRIQRETLSNHVGALAQQLALFLAMLDGCTRTSNGRRIVTHEAGAEVDSLSETADDITQLVDDAAAIAGIESGVSFRSVVEQAEETRRRKLDLAEPLVFIETDVKSAARKMIATFGRLKSTWAETVRGLNSGTLVRTNANRLRSILRELELHRDALARVEAARTRGVEKTVQSDDAAHAQASRRRNKGGRPPKASSVSEDQIAELRKQGLKPLAIAGRLGASIHEVQEVRRVIDRLRKRRTRRTQ